MLYAWKNNVSTAPRDAVATVGSYYGTVFDNDTGLLWADFNDFARSAGLTTEPAANYSLDNWISFIQRFGPIMLNYLPGGNVSAGPTHAVILVGIDSSGDYPGSTVYLADPGPGRIIATPLSTFLTQFENTVIRTNIGYPQIFHW
jgi:hypothetical protein